jgi:hypothetical protein
MAEPVTELVPRLNRLPDEALADVRAARGRRRSFVAEFGPFVKAMREAMKEYLGMRTQGVSRDDALRGLEGVIREIWPKGREREWTFYCQVCSDIGYELTDCRHLKRCGRKFCAHKDDEWEHRYAVPCGCVKGDRFRAKAYSAEDAIEKASKARKTKRGFTRAGL